MHLLVSFHNTPPGPCPTLNCVPYLLHVEKHLDTHKELTQRRQRKVKLDLKRKVALQLLRELRATDPQPPMVSTLDLDGDLAAGEGNTCANPACRTRATYLTNEVYLLQGALADAKGSCSSSSRNRPPLRRNRGMGMGTGRALGRAPRLPPPRAPPLPPPQRKRARSPRPSLRSPRPSPRSPRGARSSLRWTHGGLNRI
uniref:Uncharacterized protein n=1 Tax=Nothobranchius kadleci TaxID=1051664 RepID=A0A1A8CIR4_NOTKA